MSDERKDRIQLQPGISHLPAEFREVAKLANKAGLEGYEVVDVDYGIDVEEVKANTLAWAERAGAGRGNIPPEYEDLPMPTSYVKIRYREVNDDSAAGYREQLAAARAERDFLGEALAKTREALKPFADCARFYPDGRFKGTYRDSAILTDYERAAEVYRRTGEECSGVGARGCREGSAIGRGDAQLKPPPPG